jgi:hypothetical protein
MKEKMSKINEKRTARMVRKSDAELVKFVHAKTLSSAAAYYQLKARGKLALLAKG